MGSDTPFEGNRIGRDTDNTNIGVCGRGIYLSDGPKNLLIEDNRIIQASLSAISLNGILYDANTLRGNVIRRPGLGRRWTAAPGRRRYPGQPQSARPLREFSAGQSDDMKRVTVQGSVELPLP